MSRVQSALQGVITERLNKMNKARVNLQGRSKELSRNFRNLKVKKNILYLRENSMFLELHIKRSGPAENFGRRGITVPREGNTCMNSRAIGLILMIRGKNSERRDLIFVKTYWGILIQKQISCLLGKT